MAEEAWDESWPEPVFPKALRLLEPNAPVLEELPKLEPPKLLPPPPPPKLEPPKLERLLVPAPEPKAVRAPEVLERLQPLKQGLKRVLRVFCSVVASAFLRL